ncbi:MAG: conjugative relaxase [Ilumatobacteraceae bacterium]|nr:conjugative relaxase [Ilumatobacteraceae bacterium]
MMSLWKLRVGVESYYLAQVASGLDEYYTGAGEAAGQWTGTASELLGLSGTVAGDDLRAVLAGLAPDTGLTPNGTRLAAHARRVPGFDLTFSVPKSVSVVYALGDPLVQASVVEACQAALTEALSWLEREACFVRRGTNNRKMATDPAGFGTRRMIADGLVAAQFPHRTSRMGDPHLHWHVLVANTARGIDGRWTALDGTALYRAQRTVGVLYQTAMRRELSLRLGLEWGPTHSDSAEIAGIPTRVLREFSQRHDQIAEWLDHSGRSGPEAARQALLETRTNKQTQVDFAIIEAEWHQRAQALGWGPAELEQLLATSPGTPPNTDDNRWFIRDATWHQGESTPAARAVPFDEWVDWLLTTRVTEKSGTFTRFDLTQAIAAVLPTGTTITSVETTVGRALASPAIVQVGDHWIERRTIDAQGRIVADDRELLYTSRSLLAVEQQLLAQLTNGTLCGAGILDAAEVEAAIAASTLGDDQATAIRVLTRAGDRVAVMVGRAGTGKTHTLGTLRTVYETAGWDVIGLAPSARAARELQDGADITSTTIARHRVEQREITATTLIVVDEAAMAGTRDVATLVDQATSAGAKVVLVGDHHQLPEVSAGGAFRAALDTLDDRVVELTVNRRQTHLWEQAALDQLRNGDVPTAFAAYLEYGRVVITDTPEDLHAIVLADWNTTRTTGTTLLLAGTRAEARLLNRHAREILADGGELDLAKQIEVGGRAFTIGDQIVLGRNDPRQHLDTGETFAVDNGMRGTVTKLSAEQMTIQVTSGDHVVIDRDYLDSGWVDHAYALTIHKAQGVTCDHVLVVGPAGLYREGAYVALSRARDTARLYATTSQAAGVEERHSNGIPLPSEPVADPEAELLARLQHSAAKNLVIIDDPDAARVAELVTNVPADELMRLARHAADTELNCGVANPSVDRGALDAATATRTHIAIGSRVRAVDRDNVGHVHDINDTDGNCTVHFESTDGRTAIRTLTWERLIAIDNPNPVTLTVAAADTLAHRGEVVAEAEQEWALALAKRGVQPGDADLYRRAVHTAADQAARSLQAEPPEWLTSMLGQRPAHSAAASVWDDAATRIAHHRLLHAIPETESGIGPRPADIADAGRWQHLMLRLLEDRVWLTDHPTPIAEPLTRATPSELLGRQHDLQQLLDTAPADQRQFIDRIINSALDPTQMHDYLTAAMSEQDARRDWIIANWPHIVELEQVTQIISIQEGAPHWPTGQPDPVKTMLDQLRQLAPDNTEREDRSLAELTRRENDRDRVRQLEGRQGELQQLSHQKLVPDESAALQTELVNIGRELRQARSTRASEQAFNRYIPNPIDDARTTRITTLAADALTNQPVWVIDHVRYLHDHHGLAGTEPAGLAKRVITAAAHLDLHGDLPTSWPAPTSLAIEHAQPGIEVG